MAGTLFVVATPIGHLEDITLRALRVLREVAVVAAEDTRRSGNLLRHYDIHTPLVSLHQHNEHTRGPELVRRLLGGESVAVVTDAGTPGISDPGAGVVRAARAAGVRIEPIPGASAVVTALSVAGVRDTAFSFWGFPPVKAKDRIKWFQRLDAPAVGTVVLFEAPHRILSTLSEIGKYVKQPILVTRELTKAHEELRMDTAAALVSHFVSPIGEFTVIIPPPPADAAPAPPPSADQLMVEFGLITETGAYHSKREIARLVAEKHGLSTSFVYDLALPKKSAQ